MKIYTVLPEILNMSLTAGFIILAVLLARALLRKAPRFFSCLLWEIVLFRLLCPFSFSTPFSVLQVFRQEAAQDGSMEYIPRTSYGEQPQGALTAEAEKTEEEGTAEYESENSYVNNTVKIGTYVWLAGVVIMAGYGVVSFYRLRKELTGAIPVKEAPEALRRAGEERKISLRDVYETDCAQAPFVMGIIRPKIYLPATLSERERGYIIFHERIHIRRGDTLVKLLMFLALTLHWFNPLVWLAFHLAEKDMEMSCDEAVMKRMPEDIRAEYSTSLLEMAAGHRLSGKGFLSEKMASGTPLAFGEKDIKERVGNIMKYKRPAFAVIALTVIAVFILAVVLGSNPEKPDGKEELANRWAMAFCARDGQRIVELSTKELQDKLMGEELLTKAGGTYTFGWSSPWPWEGEKAAEIVRITEDSADILYYAQVSDPHVWVWGETIEFGEEKGELKVSGSSGIRFDDYIASGMEFSAAYPEGIEGTMMDYQKNGLGEALNDNAIRNRNDSQSVYEELFSPDRAARFLLNLSEDAEKVILQSGEKEEDGSCPVTVYFEEDGVSVTMRMVQPWGAEGIWIPQDWEGH